MLSVHVLSVFLSVCYSYVFFGLVQSVWLYVVKPDV